MALADVCRQQQLTPKAKQFYYHLLRLRKTAAQLNRRHASVKRRLQVASIALRTGDWQVLDDMDPLIANFIRSQLRNIKVPKVKRTYTVPDKVFALALFKQSPKAYRFLSKILCLPSPETLRKVVRHIPVKPGISKEVFESLKRTVAAFKDVKNKCCILLFDEMSLQPNLSYSKYEDVV